MKHLQKFKWIQALRLVNCRPMEVNQNKVCLIHDEILLLLVNFVFLFEGLRCHKERSQKKLV